MDEVYKASNPCYVEFFPTFFYDTKCKITLNAVWNLMVMDSSETQAWKSIW